jgi:hypothetical protein
LVDRLEELFHESSNLPLTKKKMVDEQAFLDIIDQMRIAIPDEIRQAKRVAEERQRLLADANDEAERIRMAAQEHAGLLLSQEGRVQLAEAKAQQIIGDARSHAEQLKLDADAHCVSVLLALETEMTTILSTTRNGIQHLEGRTGASRGSKVEASEKGK